MKTLLSLFAAVSMFAAFAGIDAQQITSKGYKPDVGAKLVHVDVLSTTAAASVDVKSISEAWDTRADVSTVVSTNTSYVLVYSNGLHQVITNVTKYSQLPLPTKVAVLSYTTNTVVNTDYFTNYVPYVAATITNSLAEITCSGGRGYANPSNVFTVPGDRIIVEGDKSRVTIYLEK